MAPLPLMRLMPEPGGKQVLCVYVWLHHHGNASEQGCFASIATLTRETGINREGVCLALRWLVENGWAERESIPGRPSHYHLKADEPGNQKAPGYQNTPRRENGPPPGSQNRPRGGPKRDHKQEPSNQIPEPEPIKTPIAPAPAAPFDVVAAAPVPKPKRSTSATDPLSRKLLPPEAVPPDLAAVADLLIEFWAAKKGTRSGPVLTRICRKLRSWPANDRITALEAAITNGWGDVFEPRKPQAIRGRDPDPGPPMPARIVKPVLPIDPETGLPDPFAIPYKPLPE